jgi:hypothetical protein
MQTVAIFHYYYSKTTCLLLMSSSSYITTHSRLLQLWNDLGVRRSY